MEVLGAKTPNQLLEELSFDLGCDHQHGFDPAPAFVVQEVVAAVIACHRAIQLGSREMWHRAGSW